MKRVLVKEKSESSWKKFWKRFWFIVWKDDSLRGWIVSLIFIFVIIKFIFFPLMSLVTGTNLPLAIVESCSMYHDKDIFGSYSDWFERHKEKYGYFGISEDEFSEFKMRKGFNKGDILFITGVKPEKIDVGDIIIFNGNQRNPVIHRVIEIREDSSTGEFVFSTIGDNNNGQLSAEKNISEDQIVGRASLRIVPFIGWGKLVFYERIRPESERGFCDEN